MYGSGVYNFFKFFKWAIGLNLIMMILVLMLITVPDLVSQNDDVAKVCQANVSLEENNLFPSSMANDCCSGMYLITQKVKQEELDVSSNIQFFEDIGWLLSRVLLGDG